MYFFLIFLMLIVGQFADFRLYLLYLKFNRKRTHTDAHTQESKKFFLFGSIGRHFQLDYSFNRTSAEVSALRLIEKGFIIR